MLRRADRSDAGGIRTRKHEGLSFAAVPVRVPRRVCRGAGDPRSQRSIQVARRGVEPRLTVSKTVVLIRYTCKPYSITVSAPGIEPDLRPSQGRVLIQYTSQTNQWCRWDSNPQSLVSKTSRSAVGVPHHSSIPTINVKVLCGS